MTSDYAIRDLAAKHIDEAWTDIITDRRYVMDYDDCRDLADDLAADIPLGDDEAEYERAVDELVRRVMTEVNRRINEIHYRIGLIRVEMTGTGGRN